MAFPDSFLDELLARTDIVDVISRQVDLKKKGGSLWGLCPFHGEKTPSFSVSQDKQLFYCFGCGVGGGAIQFVMRTENLPFVDAARVLADRAGLPVPEEDGDGKREDRETLYRLNREAARWFHGQLKAPAGARGREYIQSRGLTAGTVTRFGLGWAPDSWDSLLKAMTAAGFSKADLLAAGLAVPNKTGGLYDRFRGRLMFPIIDLRKRVIAFGGRVLDDTTPKYLNTSDTPVFSKSRNLFALYLAKNTKQGRLILAEGYMDVISLHQAGFDGAVASLGTALTGQQAVLLAKYAKELVIAYDTDAAGLKAVERAIGTLEQAGVSVRVLRMHGAKDPDEYIRRHGREAFAALLAGSETQTAYRLAALAGQFELTSDEGRLRFCREAVTLLCALPSEAERAVYAKQAADLCGIPYEALSVDVARARTRKGKKERGNTARRAMQPVQTLQPVSRELRYENARAASAEEGVVRLLFSDTSLVEEASGLLTPEEFSTPLLGRLFAYAVGNREEPGRVFASQDEFTQEELSHLARLLHKPVSFAAGAQALRDCAAVVREENLLRCAADSGEDPLLLFRQQRQSTTET